MNKKKSFSRGDAEKAEGMPQITNDVPENKVQDVQQVATTEDALKVKSEDSSFKAKRTAGKGAEVKVQAISDAITGSSNSAGMGINAAGRSVSGTGGGILGASNSTPQADKSRSASRVGKKLDRTATKLNYTPSEQVLLEVDESKPLADAASDDQGYNGTYRNEFARSQKISGAVPADLMYQRSVDFIIKDKLYFTEGQMILQANDNAARYFPSTTVREDESEVDGYVKKDVDYNLGNFLHRNLHFGLNDAGKVKYFYADVEDLSVNDVTSEDANMSSSHRLIKMNTAELDRMNMDTKAGDEKADVWSPLPRAIDEPTKAAALMSSIESSTGAYVHLAYSKASTNMAFQLNRGPKDGLDEITPAIEELCGWRSSENNSISLGNDMNNVLDTSYVFNKAAYRAGDPSLMIAAYDSIGKYHNKADLLLQPRGFRMHLQTADNNMNPLKLNKEYANVFAGTEVYSTIDHEYDPLLPICFTDKANLITPINFNELAAFYNLDNEYEIAVTYNSTSNYRTDATNKILVDHKALKAMGITTVKLAFKKAGSKANLEFDGTNNVIYFESKSPIGSDSESYVLKVLFDDEAIPTGFTQLGSNITVASMTKDIYFAVPKINSEKISAFDMDASNTVHLEPVNAGEYAYAYSDLRNNYIVHVKHPLIQGMVEYLNNAIGAKIRSLIDQDDFLIPMIFSTQHMTLAQLFICASTPWIVRVRENSMKDVIYYEDNVHEYPYSKLASLKDVPFKNYLNFDYTDYDSPLGTKVMNPVQAINWTMPEFFWKVATEKYVLPWYFNENDLNPDGTVNDDAANMSMPSIRSGVRLGLLDNFYGMTEKDIRLSLDRYTKYLLRDADISSFGAYKYGRTTDGQILANLGAGKIFSIFKLLSCPRELGLCLDAPLGVLTPDPADGTGITTGLKELTADGTATSYRIKVFTNKNTYIHPSILAAFGVNINRAANYTQKWFEITANNATSNTDLAGLVFGLGDDSGSFSPFAALGSGASLSNGVNVTSYQRALNTRLQFLPFVISPFDGNYTGSQAYDIYDFAYMFGLCGFRASDYRESVYNREKEVVNQGLLFVEDPWILDSPILKGASAGTGLRVAAGYELK